MGLLGAYAMCAVSAGTTEFPADSRQGRQSLAAPNLAAVFAVRRGLHGQSHTV